MKFGITEMPPGEQPSRYPDIEKNKLIGAIETEGVRLAWTRAADCPCAPVNTQTQQPDPNCTLCKGLGIIYFGPTNYKPSVDVGTLSDVQKSILAVDGAAVIRGVISKATQNADLYDVLGRWTWGTMLVTVRPENKIGYFDRLVNLDAEMVFFETVTAQAGQATLPLKYHAVGVNMIRSLNRIYQEGQDFVVKNGVVSWFPSQVPQIATILSVHYLIHPSWRVTDHPHVIRETATRRKVKAISPLGTPTALPIQGHIRLEFLPIPGDTP